MTGEAMQFEYDPWLYVEAVSPERALAFFGAPATWPVEYHAPSRNGGTIWRVKSEGLKL